MYVFRRAAGATSLRLETILDVGTSDAAQALLETWKTLKPMIRVMAAGKPGLAWLAMVAGRMQATVQGGVLSLRVPLGRADLLSALRGGISAKASQPSKNAP